MSNDVVGLVKPDHIREDPRLISPDSMSPELSVSLAVEPGDDPLSQLAATSPQPTREGLETEESLNILDHNYWNNDDGVKSEEVAQGHYGLCLSDVDHRNIRNFVMDLVLKRLLPHLNEVLKNLNEWVSE
jgi:hypothetical protein